MVQVSTTRLLMSLYETCPLLPELCRIALDFNHKNK